MIIRMEHVCTHDWLVLCLCIVHLSWLSLSGIPIFWVMSGRSLVMIVLWWWVICSCLRNILWLIRIILEYTCRYRCAVLADLYLDPDPDPAGAGRGNSAGRGNPSGSGRGTQQVGGFTRQRGPLIPILIPILIWWFTIMVRWKALPPVQGNQHTFHFDVQPYFQCKLRHLPQLQQRGTRVPASSKSNLLIPFATAYIGSLIYECWVSDCVL